MKYLAFKTLGLARREVLQIRQFTSEVYLRVDDASDGQALLVATPAGLDDLREYFLALETIRVHFDINIIGFPSLDIFIKRLRDQREKRAQKSGQAEFEAAFLASL